MSSDVDDARKHSLTIKFRVWGIVSLCILFIVILLAAFGLLSQNGQKRSKPSPPDLSRCTHLEIQCHPSLIKLIYPPMGFDPNFLSAAETEYLQSLEKFIIKDKKSIKALASEVSSGSYMGGTEGINPAMYKYHLSVVCYRNYERIALITMYQLVFIVTENKHKFDYDRDLPDPLLLAPPRIRSLVLRCQCGSNLWCLYDELIRFSRSAKAYPARIGWRAMIVQKGSTRDGRGSVFSEEKMREVFKCPGADKGKNHYALNPYCKPNSLPDTVLLFETKAGWNLPGGPGPELFTFDNHDPKGGCVLLNDGTVKFIRTKEELQHLRWK